MQCDMCGSESSLVRAEIEGTELTVCSNCARYGKVLRSVQKPKPIAVPKSRPRQVRKEIVLIIKPGYAKLVRDKREKMGLKQEQLAKRLAEKESLIQKIENASIEPSIALARKLEKVLNIELITEHEEKNIELTKSKGENLTIGDMINIRKR